MRDFKGEAWQCTQGTGSGLEGGASRGGVSQTPLGDVFNSR